MKEIAELVSQIGISSIIALLLWNFLKSYIEEDRERFEEEKKYLKQEIDRNRNITDREREEARKEREEFRNERKETMDKFLEQLNLITNITNNNSENISRLADKMEEISKDIFDIRQTIDRQKNSRYNNNNNNNRKNRE